MHSFFGCCTSATFCLDPRRLRFSSKSEAITGAIRSWFLSAFGKRCVLLCFLLACFRAARFRAACFRAADLGLTHRVERGRADLKDPEAASGRYKRPRNPCLVAQTETAVHQGPDHALLGPRLPHICPVLCARTALSPARANGGRMEYQSRHHAALPRAVP